MCRDALALVHSLNCLHVLAGPCCTARVLRSIHMHGASLLPHMASTIYAHTGGTYIFTLLALVHRHPCWVMVIS